MNYVEKSSRWLFCTLGLMLAAFVMAELCYSHDIPTPVDVQSSDDTPVELVVHKDLYDGKGNFVAHIHEYSISSYTQEEVDEIHENNPHTRQSVIDGLPKEGDVKGVHGRSYDTPGFSEPDNTDNIGRPDPDGEYESYGIVTLQNPNNQAESSSTQNTQGIQPSSQEIQGSQGTPPAIQTKTANYNGDPRKFEEVSAPESSDEELYVINEKNEAILATDPYQYDGTLYRLLSSSATRRNESGTRQLEIVGVVEVGSPRRLIVTLRNHTKRFIDLTQRTCGAEGVC